MNSQVTIIQPQNRHQWDRYVRSKPESGIFHLYGWNDVIKRTYGHDSLPLMAVSACSENQFANGPDVHQVKGVLNLTLLRNRMTGTRLVSMPFLDSAGVLADSPDIEKALVKEAVLSGRKRNAQYIEIRHALPFKFTGSDGRLPGHFIKFLNSVNYRHKIRSHKSGLEMPLKESSACLMKSFKSKLRSQIKKSIKNGMHIQRGGMELLSDFYGVFARNMRDLGSPVHHKLFFANVIEEFEKDAVITIIRFGKKPVAGSVILRYGDTITNPFASSVKKFRRLGSNMLLYWSMLEYACDHGYKTFNFGRSSHGAGTFHFKLQWGASSRPLSWYYFYEKNAEKIFMNEKLSYGLWKKIPVSLSETVGPFFRKNISL